MATKQTPDQRTDWKRQAVLLVHQNEMLRILADSYKKTNEGYLEQLNAKDSQIQDLFSTIDSLNKRLQETIEA